MREILATVGEAEGHNVLDVVTNKQHNAHLDNEKGIAVNEHIEYMARDLARDHNIQRKSEWVEAEDRDWDKDQQRAEDKLCTGLHKHRVVHTDLPDMTGVENRSQFGHSHLGKLALVQPIE